MRNDTIPSFFSNSCYSPTKHKTRTRKRHTQKSAPCSTASIPQINFVAVQATLQNGASTYIHSATTRTTYSSFGIASPRTPVQSRWDAPNQQSRFVNPSYLQPQSISLSQYPLIKIGTYVLSLSMPENFPKTPRTHPVLLTPETRPRNRHRSKTPLFHLQQ